MFGGNKNTETDEHPPANIQIGQQLVARVVNALFKSPNWPCAVGCGVAVRAPALRLSRRLRLAPQEARPPRRPGRRRTAGRVTIGGHSPAIARIGDCSNVRSPADAPKLPGATHERATCGSDLGLCRVRPAPQLVQTNCYGAVAARCTSASSACAWRVSS